MRTGSSLTKETNRVMRERQTRMLRIGVGVLGLLVIAATALAIWAYNKSVEAEEARREAEHALKVADSSKRAASVSSAESADRLQTITQILTDTHSNIYAAASESPRLAQTLWEAAVKDTVLMRTIDVKSLPARVFLHIQDESQRRFARRLESLLKERNFIVPGIERVDARFSRRADIRYFHEPERAEAEKVARILESAGTGDVEVKFVKATGVPWRQYEVWLPRTGARIPDARIEESPAAIQNDPIERPRHDLNSENRRLVTEQRLQIPRVQPEARKETTAISRTPLLRPR